MRNCLLLLTVLLAATVWGQQRASAYLPTSEMPNAVLYLPPPPDTTGSQFAYDMSQYYWGKSVRNTERGRQAIDDAKCSARHLLEMYSEPMGLATLGVTLSSDQTPAIFKMMSNALATGVRGASVCKNHYRRIRPFQRFGEPVGSGEGGLANTSYPSGHTNLGWLAALLLVEVNPKAQNALLRRGYEYGQSRVIVGAHWQSDVDAGRVVASACYARLHSDSTFLAEMAAAREEFARITELHSTADTVRDHYDELVGSGHTPDDTPPTATERQAVRRE